MNVKTLSNLAAADVGVTQATAAAVVNAFLDNVAEVLVNGEQVRIRDFMTLSVVRHDACMRRNVYTGESFMGKPTARIRCKTAKRMKAILRGEE